jgi:hypothetical protein
MALLDGPAHHFVLANPKYTQRVDREVIGRDRRRGVKIAPARIPAAERRIAKDRPNLRFIIDRLER